MWEGMGMRYVEWEKKGPVCEVELGWGSDLSGVMWVWNQMDGCGVSVVWEAV